MARRYGRSPIAVMNDFFFQPLLRRGRRSPFPWLQPEYGRRADGEAMRAATAETGGHAGRVNQRLFRDVKWGNAKVVLGLTDRTSMAHSIEARVPFFDLRLMQLAYSLPDHFKVGRGERKRILRDVARRFLPPAVTERKDRMGFGTPDRDMIRGALWPEMEERIRAADGPMFSAALPRFIDDFRSGAHDDFRAVWRIYALTRWAAEFGVTLR
jgi:asparagine synthase (glutamine-hydrolysing)